MHCHMEFHNLLGMALIVKEGEVEEMPPTPEGFPQCGDFKWSSDEYRKRVARPSLQQMGEFAESYCADKFFSKCLSSSHISNNRPIVLYLD